MATTDVYKPTGWQAEQQAITDKYTAQGVAPGSLVLDGQVTSPKTSAIPADQIGTSNAIKVPSLNTDVTQADGMVAGAEAGAKTIQDYLKEVTPPETPTSKSYNDLLGQINTLLPDLANKKSDQLKTEQNLGLPDMQKQLADLNGQVTTRLAEYNKAIAQTETAPGETPLGLVLGRQAVIRRNEASDIGLLNARQLALQGNIEAAQATANRAIDLKYGTMEDILNVKLKQLELIQPILDKEERTYAAALQRQYQDQQQALADKKAQEQAIQTIAMNAAQSGATPDVLAAIGKAANPMEAISLAGKFLAAPFKLQQQQVAISNYNAHKPTISIQDNADGTKSVVTIDSNGNIINQQPIANGSNGSGELKLAQSEQSIGTVTNLLSDKALNSSVGPIAAARGAINLPFGIKIPTTLNTFTGAQQNFIGAVEKLRSQLNLDSLIKAKSQGATFGALSDQELKILGSSATKLGTWAVTDGKGNVVGYNVDEKSFKNELSTINNFAKLDYIIKGGDPSQVGVRIEKDGSLTTMNWDGTVTQLLK